MREHIVTLRRRGFVVAISGGVDSAVCAALAVRAVGAPRVFALLLPERESSPESTELGRAVVSTLGIASAEEDITGQLEAAGCYRRRDETIAGLVPGYGRGWGCKLVLPADRLDSDQLNVSALVVRSPAGETTQHRLPPRAYSEIVAATNFKQRVRTMLAYYHADRLHAAVVGTPNRLEYDLGFFVKGGDGLADVKPIAHLYKCQVYQLARALGVPSAVIERTPTTDTFTLPQTQEEFYYAVPLPLLDRLLHAYDNGVGASDAAAALDLAERQVARVYEDIARKRVAAEYLHLPGLLVGGVAPSGR